MIASLITSQTRIKLLIKFFLNSSTRAHLRGLESEFGDSTNGIRVELNRMEGANLLRSEREGNKKVYYANRKHPLYEEIHNIIIKETGIDRVIAKVIDKIGELWYVYLTGDLAHGRDSSMIELILVGRDLDNEYLERKTKQAKEITGRDVRCTLLGLKESRDRLSAMQPDGLLLLWSKENGNAIGDRRNAKDDI